MKRLLLLLGVGALLLVASSRAPQIFEAGDHLCVYIGGELDCFCPCEKTTVDCGKYSENVTPTPQIAVTLTPLSPTATKVVPTTTPSATAAPCNRGTGNGPEGCDPGNSGGRPGNAGEGNE